MTNYLSSISLVISLLLIVYTFLTNRKVSSFTRGKSGASLEDIMTEDRKTVIELQKENTELKSKISNLEKKMSQAVRSVSVVRFNPFPDQGGNQSFATALVDEKGDGVVLSSLFARERTSIFAKQLSNFKSTNELSKEEMEVVEKTKQNQYDK